MFETAILSQGPQTKRMWTTCLGFAGQAVLVGGMLVGPLIWPQALPRFLQYTSISPPEPYRPPPPDLPRFEPTTRFTHVRADHSWYVPTKVPSKVLMIDDAEYVATASFATSTGARETGPIGLDVIGVVSGSGTRPVPPTPVTPKAPTPVDPPKPPRVTVMQMAEPIQRVNPIYPEMAKRMRVSGKVELMGVLGTDGRIHELKVISGHPLLVKAAADAVLQWVYRPTILNGQAVEVSAPITVNFILTN